MKNIRKTIIILLALPVLTFVWSCSDEFIQKEPAFASSIDVALGSYSDMAVALNGIYHQLQDPDYYGKNFVLNVDIRADHTNLNLDNSNRMTSQYQYTMTQSSGDANNTWGIMYKVISLCNQIIARVDDLEDGSEDQRNQIKGEALTLRALAYFDLVRQFAQPYNLPASAASAAAGSADGNGGHLGVPLVLEPVEDIFNFIPARNTVKEVYDQVLTDLNNAIPLLTIEPANSNTLSAMAATAIRARVKLYKEDWGGAAADATTVINSGNYALLTPSNYISSWAAENSSESIFEIQMTSTDYNSTAALGYMYDSRGYGDMIAADALLALFEESDVRGTIADGVEDNGPPSPDIMFYHVITNTGASINYSAKYPGRSGTAGLDNTKIIRLSEMYLIRAEANLEAGTSTGASPLDDINSIRINRNASELGAVTLADVQDERARELCFEGHRLFDLTRKGQDLVRGSDFWAATSVPFPDSRFAYPIPEDEKNVNENITQNPGY